MKRQEKASQAEAMQPKALKRQEKASQAEAMQPKVRHDKPGWAKQGLAELG